MQIDYKQKTVTVAQRITFSNQESTALPEIVLDVQANQWPQTFFLEGLQVAGQDIEPVTERNRLSFALPQPLAPGCSVDIELAFQLQPPSIRDGIRSYRGFLGYSQRQLNLGHALPTVAARIGGNWRIHEPVGIGEQIVSDMAQWQVSLKVDNAADSLQLAAPGTVTALGQGSWTIKQAQARDFVLSLSEEFSLAEHVLPDGRVVAVYAFADAQIFDRGVRLDGMQHALQSTVAALEVFEELFGNYPYQRLVLVQGDFPDGMEFTGLVFVGSAWFYSFDGGMRNYLSIITVHEIAHQWWYARVGSDAALAPWLDEALATYSEFLFLEAAYAQDSDWWWSFRVAGFFPQGMVDAAVYEFSTPRAYINAIYLRGAQMLHKLRQDIGDEAFFQLLRAYYADGDGSIVDPSRFWYQLSPAQYQASAPTRQEFLRQPDIQEWSSS